MNDWKEAKNLRQIIMQSHNLYHAKQTSLEKQGKFGFPLLFNKTQSWQYPPSLFHKCWKSKNTEMSSVNSKMDFATSWTIETKSFQVSSYERHEKSLICEVVKHTSFPLNKALLKIMHSLSAVYLNHSLDDCPLNFFLAF